MAIAAMVCWRESPLFMSTFKRDEGGRCLCVNFFISSRLTPYSYDIEEKLFLGGWRVEALG